MRPVRLYYAASLPSFEKQQIFNLALSSQFSRELVKDMRMVINIFLCVLDGDCPLIIKARREEDSAICQEEPVGIRDIHVNFPPGAIITRTLKTEHGTTLRTNLSNMHRQIKFLDNTYIGFPQLFRKIIGMCVSFSCEDLCECHQSCTHRHTATNRLCQADQVWFHRIKFRDPTWSYSHTGLDFVEDQQYPVPAGNITHILEIAFIRQHNANIHQDRFGDYSRHLAFVLAQDAIQNLGIIVWGNNCVLLHISRNAF